MSEPDYIQLHRTIIGGEPVHLDKKTGKLYIAGDQLDFEQWLKLVDKINKLYRNYSEGKGKCQ